MKRTLTVTAPEIPEQDWVALPGGELEAPRPRTLCASCRARLQQAAKSGLGWTAQSRQPLCFACYRAGLERDRQINAAGQLHTASEARFQDALPFEPINQSRLRTLRAARASARVTMQAGVGRYVDKRRQAQIAARHALHHIAAGLRDRAIAATGLDVGLSATTSRRTTSNTSRPSMLTVRTTQSALEGARNSSRATNVAGRAQVDPCGSRERLAHLENVANVSTPSLANLANAANADVPNLVDLEVPANLDAESRWWSAVHAAELQLPESWLPFVVSR